MDADQSTAPSVEFTGWRSELLGILLHGYMLMLVTLGIYRFWLVTNKRRFYWSQTKIDGDRLEYTGTAKQLFIGFLVAVAVLLPLYLLVLFAGTQSPEIAAFGSVLFAVLIYLLSGYALYRSRRFRLTRTLWRGIRFHQGGNAWNYALRRFGWTLLTIVTLGLAYPFMAADLWRYRYNNTWYGDHQFKLSGTWRTIAWTYYKIYLINIAVIAIFGFIAATSASSSASDDLAVVLLPLLGLALPILLGLDFVYLKARITSRMLSTVSVGEAAVNTRIKARTLLGMYVVYALMLILTSLVLLFIVLVTAMMLGMNIQPGLGQPVAFMALSIVGYVLFLGISSLIAELYLGLGYWKLVAQSTNIQNVDDLRNVKALGEESPLLGEGLADALDVGAY